jgi:hypothetical protein
MNLNDWAAIATILQAIFLPVSLFFVWYQLRQQSKFARATNVQSLVELSSPFNLQLIQDRNFAQLWVQGASRFEAMDEVERYQFKSLLIWWLILHENIFYQHEEKLVDDTAYFPWDEDLKGFIRTMRLGNHWSSLRGTFQAGFAAHVDKLIHEDTGSS